MVHVFAARGTEAGDHETARAFSLRGMPSGIRTHDGLSPLGPGIVNASCNLVKGSAFADGFVDGAAGTPTKTAEREVLGTIGVVDRTPAWTASAACHLALVAEAAIAINARAVEPRGVEELSRLYVEADSDRAFFTKCIG
jgi:hypothetical protein